MSKEFNFHVNRPFYIVSRMPMNRLISWTGGNIKIGKYTGSSQQQWVFDGETKTIKSNWRKNMSINIEGNGRSSNV
jgi:hypothetical protein